MVLSQLHACMYSAILYQSMTDHLCKTLSVCRNNILSCKLTSLHRHFYFTRIVRLWNYVPVIDISLPPEIIKNQLVKYLWYNFSANFNSEFPCTFHLLCPCHRCSNLPTSRNFNNLTNVT